LVFKSPKDSLTNHHDYTQWWLWKIGASWKQPHGPGSDLKGKEQHPVVHIAYEDALAYCQWAGRRLPTEAEWEYAARALKEHQISTWQSKYHLNDMANTWDGSFPYENAGKDGYAFTAPVRSYPPNDFGLYDMNGNVWEWTSDWYNTHYYASLGEAIQYNPSGADKAYNSSNPLAQEKVIKGGSFLCHESYCANYRISARMGTSLDSSLEHLGFRTVATLEMVKRKSSQRNQ